MRSGTHRVLADVENRSIADWVPSLIVPFRGRAVGLGVGVTTMRFKLYVGPATEPLFVSAPIAFDVRADPVQVRCGATMP